MKYLLQCCETNLALSTATAIHQLEERMELEVLMEPCLDECEACVQQLFFYLEGERVHGDTSAGLLAAALMVIKRREEMERLLDRL